MPRGRWCSGPCVMWVTASEVFRRMVSEEAGQRMLISSFTECHRNGLIDVGCEVERAGSTTARGSACVVLMKERSAAPWCSTVLWVAPEPFVPRGRGWRSGRRSAVTIRVRSWASPFGVWSAVCTRRVSSSPDRVRVARADDPGSWRCSGYSPEPAFPIRLCRVGDERALSWPGFLPWSGLRREGRSPLSGPR